MKKSSTERACSERSHALQLDTIRLTSGMNIRVRADSALLQRPREPSDSKRKRKTQMIGHLNKAPRAGCVGFCVLHSHSLSPTSGVRREKYSHPHSRRVAVCKWRWAHARVQFRVLWRTSSSSKSSVIEQALGDHCWGTERSLVKLVPRDAARCRDNKAEEYKVR
jgi:hypothetical protein